MAGERLLVCEYNYGHQTEHKLVYAVQPSLIPRSLVALSLHIKEVPGVPKRLFS